MRRRFRLPRRPRPLAAGDWRAAERRRVAAPLPDSGVFTPFIKAPVAAAVPAVPEQRACPDTLSDAVTGASEDVESTVALPGPLALTGNVRDPTG